MAAVGKALVFGGNWKATMTPAQTRQFFRGPAGFGAVAKTNRAEIEQAGARIIIAPPSACLETARRSIEEEGLNGLVELGVQDPWHRAGAYTGATTFEAAQDEVIRAEVAVIGHSERREPWRIIEKAFLACLQQTLGPRQEEAFAFQAATFPTSVIANVLAQIDVNGDKPAPFSLDLDAIIAAKVRRSLEVNMTPILCIGETEEERTGGNFINTILGQLNMGLEGLSPAQIRQVVVAYEPVWSIGTGLTASDDQAQEAHAAIDARLVELTGAKDHGIQIIYGGSMKPDNVAGLVTQPDVYGGLIGGASLKPAVFMKLIMNGIRAQG